MPSLSATKNRCTHWCVHAAPMLFGSFKSPFCSASLAACRSLRTPAHRGQMLALCTPGHAAPPGVTPSQRHRTVKGPQGRPPPPRRRGNTFLARHAGDVNRFGTACFSHAHAKCMPEHSAAEVARPMPSFAQGSGECRLESHARRADHIPSQLDLGTVLCPFASVPCGPGCLLSLALQQVCDNRAAPLLRRDAFPGPAAVMRAWASA